MATVTVEASETRCDRCDKRIAREREQVCLTASGVGVPPDRVAAANAIDLCGPCHESLRKWWARKAGGE